MTRKLKVRSQALSDALKPKAPATLADPELSLVAPSEIQEEAVGIAAEDKGGAESLIVGDTTISGDHLSMTSPKDSKRLATSMSKGADHAEGTSVSPVKRQNPVVVTTTQEVMEAHAEVINQLLDKGTQTHLDLAKACVKARDEVGRKSHDDFVSMLSMSKAEFSKYCAIGKKSLLYDPDLHHHLPTSFSSLYVISMLDDGSLRNAIDKKWVTPQSTRAELERLLPAKRRRAGEEIRSLPGPWFAVIELDPECDDNVRHDVHTALAKLKSSNPAIVRVVDQIDLDQANRQREEERKHQIFLKQLRVLVKQEVKHARKTGRRGAQQNEELKIAKDADECRLRQVLLLVQREGKYDELVELAKRGLGISNSPPPDDGNLQIP